MSSDLVGFRDEFLRRTDVTYLELLENSSAGFNVEGVASAALNKGFRHFCTWPHLLDSVKTRLPGMASVIAFPVGIKSVDDKLNDVARIAQMAPYVNEFDIVMNIAAGPEFMLLELGQLMWELKSYDADKYVFKFIIETPIWNRHDLNSLARSLSLSDISKYPNMMIKTCTGTQGAIKLSDMSILTTQPGSPIRIKASGGIRTPAMARLLIEEYGVERLGIGHESAFQILMEINDSIKKA